MSKHLERSVCICGKEYLFGGAYEETVCPGCLPVRDSKKFKRTQEQAQRLLLAWQASLGLEQHKPEATAA